MVPGPYLWNSICVEIDQVHSQRPRGKEAFSDRTAQLRAVSRERATGYPKSISVVELSGGRIVKSVSACSWFRQISRTARRIQLSRKNTTTWPVFSPPRLGATRQNCSRFTPIVVHHSTIFLVSRGSANTIQYEISAYDGLI